MEQEKYLDTWREEERASFHGWDFSHLDGRWKSEDLPWDYLTLARANLRDADELLDLGTGGGELLLSLGHRPDRTSVTEGYAPNLALCRRRLAPLGVRVYENDGEHPLPLENAQFDVVLNRHESYDPAEVFRVLRPGGIFLTQQVGGRNNRTLSERLIPGFQPPFSDWGLEYAMGQAKSAGFSVLKFGESFPALQFFDVGAVVYYAKIILWEFPGFTVDGCLEGLTACQKELEETGAVHSAEHRFYLLCQK